MDINLSSYKTVDDLRLALFTSDGDKLAMSLVSGENGTSRLKAGNAALRGIKCFFNIGNAREENRRMLGELMRMALHDPSFAGLDREVKDLFKATNANRKISLGTIRSLVENLQTISRGRAAAVIKRTREYCTLAYSNGKAQLPVSIQEFGDLAKDAHKKLLDRELEPMEAADVVKKIKTPAQYLNDFNARFDEAVGRIFNGQKDTDRARWFLSRILESADDPGITLKDIEKHADDIARTFSKISSTYADDEVAFKIVANQVLDMHLDCLSKETAEGFWPSYKDTIDKSVSTIRGFPSRGGTNSIMSTLSDITNTIEKGLTDGFDPWKGETEKARKKLSMDCKTAYVYRSGFVQMATRIAISRMTELERGALYDKLMAPSAFDEVRYCMSARGEERATSHLREVITRSLISELADSLKMSKAYKRLDHSIDEQNRNDRDNHVEMPEAFLQFAKVDPLAGSNWPIDLTKVPMYENR